MASTESASRELSSPSIYRHLKTSIPAQDSMETMKILHALFAIASWQLTGAMLRSH
jgi:hypothetical protein